METAESRPDMKRRIDGYGLRNKFRLHGAIDFQTELIPTIKKSVDLFVCCHQQGDPSCTYVETFACGVPILGYNNDALQGMIQRAPVGWTTSMGNIEALASRIIALGRNRNEIMITTNAARRFALENNFDRKFEARIDHLASLAKKP